MKFGIFENVRLRLGQGVIAKTTFALVAVVAAVVAISIFAKHDTEFYVALGAIVVLFLTYVTANFLNTRFFPYHALLEGANLLAYFRGSQGIKGMPDVAEVLAIEDPGPPSLPAPREEQR